MRPSAPPCNSPTVSLVHPDRRGLALPRRDRGHGDAPDRRLVDGGPPAGGAVHRCPGHGPAALPAARGADPPQRPRRAGRIQAVVATPRRRRLRWLLESGARSGPDETACGHQGGPRRRGVRITDGSGRRSRRGARARTPRPALGCRRPWGSGGSGGRAACHRHISRGRRSRCRGAICCLPSGRRSPSCALAGTACGRSPAGWSEHTVHDLPRAAP
jgi:hypothetical protein